MGEIQHALQKAVVDAIQEMGVPAFRKTSFFMSSRKKDT